MSDTKPTPTFLKDYKAPPYAVVEIALDFDLDAKKTLVRSTMKIRRQNGARTGTPLFLHGKELKLIGAALNGEALTGGDYTLSDEGLTLLSPPDDEEFTLEFETQINPQDNKTLAGLYMSSDFFTTQCESEGFRRITFSMDRPDVMAKFRTRISASKAAHPVLLSNGNCIGSGDLDGGRHWAEWEDPFPKPTYLFALVAGDLACVSDTFTTMSGRKVDLKIYVEHGKEARCAYAMDALIRSMKWDEETFGLEYDLDIFMIVAVSAFNAGAMENKGLNIFNDKYILADPEMATDADYENVEGIVAHEYFHNWTGNRITCRDWFQLCLKEGLTVFRDQLFTADMRSAAVKRVKDVALLRRAQFPEDAGPLAHPVRPASFIEADNFFTTTVYEKGAELCRMLQTLLGVDGFRKGMDLYFERHDGEAATVEDFVGAMAGANGEDLSFFLKWYAQSGTPQISVESNYDAAAKTFDLTLRQETKPTADQAEKGPLQIPVRMGLVSKSGYDLPLRLEGEAAAAGTTRVVTLTSEETHLRFVEIAEDAVPSLFREFSAPVKITSDMDDDDKVLLMGSDSDPFNRWEAGRRFVMSTLVQMAEALDKGGKVEVPQAYIEATRRNLLDPLLDPAFKALTLAVPGEIEIGQEMEQVLVEPIHEARVALMKTVAISLQTELTGVYDSLRSNEPYSPDAASAGRRSLRNSALGLLSATGSAEDMARVVNQAKSASNMTDTMAALQILCHLDTEERGVCLDAFYERWQHEPIIVNKWYSLQAVSSLPGTLDRAMALMDHPSFTIDNPNRVFALLGGLAEANQLRFHDASGKGYTFLADQILRIDKINPEVASGLCEAFANWKRFDPARTELMGKELRRIGEAKTLSPNLYEIAGKLLA